MANSTSLSVLSRAPATGERRAGEKEGEPVAVAAGFEAPIFGARIVGHSIPLPSRRPTKHILRAAEFLRDLVSRGVISVEHLPGVVMLADLLTKAASRAIFTGLIKQLEINK